MRLFLYTFAFLVLSTIIGVISYYINDDFRFFLKKLKDGNQVVYVEKGNVTDELKVDSAKKDELEGIDLSYFEEYADDDKMITTETGNDLPNLGCDEKEVIKYKDVPLLNINELKILSFFRGYDMYEVASKNIFDLGFGDFEEFAPISFESDMVSVYFFSEGTYDEIKEYVTDKTFSSNYSMNEVNNFGDSSFYINSELEDIYVRLIIKKYGEIFGIKVIKNQYDNVKNILLK